MSRFEPDEWVYEVTYHYEPITGGRTYKRILSEKEFVQGLRILAIRIELTDVVLDSIQRKQYRDYPAQAPAPVEMGMPPLYEGEQ